MLPSLVLVLPVRGRLHLSTAGMMRLCRPVLVLVVVVVLVAVTVVLVVLVVIAVVLGMVVAVLLQVCSQDPFALWWDSGRGHHLHPLKL